MTGTLASLDGRILPTEEARIPVTDDGLLRGDGVFEVIRLYGGRPFALDEHLDRMARSAADLRLPFDVDAVRADVEALLGAAEPGDGALRLVLTRGGRRIALLEPMPELPADDRARARSPTRRRACSTGSSRSPTRRTCSRRGSRASRAPTRRCSSRRTAACSRRRRRRSSASLGGERCARRRSATTSSTRSRAARAARASPTSRSASLTLDELARAERGVPRLDARARCSRSHAIDGVALAAAPGPVSTDGRAAASRERIAAELAEPA